jgi:arylsulfatase A-like enzyme
MRGEFGYLRLALAAGLLTGLGETGLLLIKRFARDRFITVGEHSFWMAPIADGLLFVALAAVFLLLTRRLTPVRRDRWYAVLLVGLSLMTMLTLWGRFYPVASMLLSLGIALRAAGLFSRRLAQLERWGIRAVPMMLVLVFLIAAAVMGERKWKERHAVGPGSTEPHPNLLLIILDTVRAFNLSLYGHERPTTPQLERWSSHATVFERALAPSSWTLPSHSGMFTGRWQTELSVLFTRRLDGTYPTLAEALRDAGYATGGFVANLIYTSRESGLARGFARYSDFELTFGAFLRSATLTRKIVDRPRIRWFLNRWHPALWKPAHRVTSEALDWISEREGRPWFAFLNYMEAHDPENTPAPYDTLFGLPSRLLYWKDLTIQPVPPPEIRARMVQGYDGAIAFLDAHIGGLLDSLKARGQLENTIVIISSDHGEEFGEHGRLGHGITLYRTAIQVPLVILAPRCEDHGHRENAPVSLQDLPATVMDLLRIRQHPFPGASFAGLICDPSAEPGSHPLFSVLRESARPGSPTLVTVAADSLQYISAGDTLEELYNIDRDPLEQTNLAGTAEGAAQIARLRPLADSIRNLPQGGPRP